MELKDTLLMPKTSFPMRGNLPVKEVDIQKFWEDENVYNKLLETRKDAEPYILHDGPPYANGAIHTGHAMNKLVKDFINRYKLIQGHRVQYVPGWDTHGLPIEQAVTTKLKVNRKEFPVSEFRAICEKYALEQIAIQQEGFERLGMFTDWDVKYITLYPEYEAEQLRIFGKMLEKDYIYKGFRTIYWSPSSESALAEAEIEYKDKVSASIFVAFEVTDGKGVIDEGTKAIIWTTTPWTIPSNLGISVHPEYTYVVVDVAGTQYLVAKELLPAVQEKLEWDNYKIVKEVTGSDLEFVQTKHPLFDRNSPIVLGEHVTLDAGSGLVHTAPGHGEEDFEVGKKYDLGMLSPVDEKGMFTEEAGKYVGMFYDDVNKAVTADLEACDALLNLELIKHSYPHDWRTKQPVIYRATDQWFASIDKIREQLLERLDDIEWAVPWGKTRLGNMLATRGDWGISRQRVWGVPIPIFYTEEGNPILDPELIEHVAKIVEKEGSNVWYERDAKDLLPDGYTHPESPNGVFEKETDTMDVWFDSGSSHAYMRKKFGFDFPVDMYMEGSDQYRGWFNSSLTTSTAAYNETPYKTLLSHGMVLDGKGHKMSKSLGNTVDPMKLIKQYGVEIIRLWVSSVDFRADVRISDEILKQVAESYRKVRNTYRFLLGNLNEFDWNNKVAFENLEEIDQYTLVKFKEYMNKAMESYDAYEFMEVYKATLQFVTNELSALYLDYAKDILYIERKDDKRRLQVQTVLAEVLVGMVKILSPILAHTSEEVWQVMREMSPEFENITSVFELTLPKTEEFTAEDRALIQKWDGILSVRQDVLKALEVARAEQVIGKSLEAHVYLKPKDADVLAPVMDDLNRLFIVSKVTVGEHEKAVEYDNSSVYVEVYDVPTCPRCWNRFEAETLDEEGLCQRCHGIVEELRAEEDK